MKKLISMVVVLISIAASVSGAPRFTADFYLGDRERYQDKMVTVHVSHVLPWKVSFNHKVLEDYYPFSLSTAYKGKRGGTIYALVHKSKAKNFIRNYGKEARYINKMSGKQIASKAVKGQFYKWIYDDGHEWIVIIK